MHHKEVSRVIKIPSEQVWKVFSDLTTVYDWNPHVKKADVLSAQSTGVGATRVCYFYDGTSLKEEVTFQDEDKQQLTMNITEMAAPVEQFETNVSVTPIDGHSSKITFSMDYEMKHGPLGYVMGATIVKNRLKAGIGKAQAGLDQHLRTGKTVVGPDLNVAVKQ